MNRILMQQQSLREQTGSRFNGHPVECNRCTLIGSAFCRALRVEAPMVGKWPRIQRFRKGAVIVDQGEIPSFLGVLRKGYIRQEHLRLNGDHVVLGLACPGEIIGGLTGVAANFASEAATDVEVCAFDRATVERLISEGPRFRYAIMREANRKHQRLLGSAWRLSALDSRERIIAFLVDAAEFMPTEFLPDGSLILQIEVSRRDWADLTNTAVETISRTIRYLEEKNMLTRLTPYRFHIRDLKRLAFLAGIDPPELSGKRGDRQNPSKDQRASNKTAERMTPVNARVLDAGRVGDVQNTTAAPRPGDVKRRLHNV